MVAAKLTEKTAHSLFKILLDKENEAFSSASKDKESATIGLEAVKLAVWTLNLKLRDEDLVTLIEKVDADKDGKLTRTEFMHLFHSPYTFRNLWIAFGAGNPKNGILKNSEVHTALKSLGVEGFTQIESFSMRKYSIDRSTLEGVSFNIFCQLTYPAILQVHRILCGEREEGATWGEIVRSVQTMSGAMVMLLFSSIPKPTHLFLNDTIGRHNESRPIPPLPMMYNPEKSTVANAIDVVTLSCLVSWGGFFLLSLRLRGSRLARVCDLLSLACAFGAISLLLHALNPYMVVVFVGAVLAFGLALFKPL